MKLIVHAPPYMAGRAADIAASAWHRGDLEENSLIGFASGVNYFSIKRNKASVTVWHTVGETGESIDPDKWEAF